MEKRRGVSLSRPAVLTIVLAMTLVAYLIANSLHNGSKVPLSTALSLNISAYQDVKIGGDSVYYYDGTILHSLNSSGKYNWSVAAGVDAQYTVSDDGIAIWTGKTLTLVDGLTGKNLYTGTMEANILSARVGSSYAAVVLSPEHDSSVKLIEHGGTVVETIAFEDTTILDYGFFSTSSLFWAMTLDSTGTVPTCTISTYKPGKMITGSIADTQQVLYQVLFQSSQICAVGTTHLRVYDYTCIEQTSARRLVYGWYLQDVDKEAENPLMLFVPNSQIDGSPRISDVRMIRGNAESIVHLPYTCVSLVASGDKLYGFSDEYVVICPMGQTVSTAYKMPISANNVIGITSDKVAVVTSNNMVYLVRLP